jgi:hypothetical protein
MGNLIVFVVLTKHKHALQHCIVKILPLILEIVYLLVLAIIRIAVFVDRVPK